MADSEILTKRVAINKANTQMVVVVAVAAFITVFCLFAAHAVWSLNSYQERVTTAKEKANNQLKANISAYGTPTTSNTLTNSYEKFILKSPNAIGGQPDGTGPNDGNNAKIVLDALPPSYDFPALTSTLEKILNERGFKVSTMTGTDDQLNQQKNASSASPQPVPMPFTFSVSSASYASVGQLVGALQSSIRPIQIDTMELSGSTSDMTLTITAHTYYQPSKSLSITKETIK